MAKTIAQLQREIASQRKRIAKEQGMSKAIYERQELSRELFKLKNRKLIGTGAKAKRLSKRFGKGLVKTGKTIAPVIQKQAKLIRDQQLRDDAIERARSKSIRKSNKKSKNKSNNSLGIFEFTDF